MKNENQLGWSCLSEKENLLVEDDVKAFSMGVYDTTYAPRGEPNSNDQFIRLENNKALPSH